MGVTAHYLCHMLLVKSESRALLATSRRACARRHHLEVEVTGLSETSACSSCHREDTSRLVRGFGKNCNISQDLLQFILWLCPDMGWGWSLTLG